MVKLTKDKQSLYCGTIERIAKLAPVVGLNPNDEPVYLSDVSPGLLAFFASTKDGERFGIVEVATSFLDSANFLPAEWYLEQSSRQKVKAGKEHKRLEGYRKDLDKYRAKWRESLQKMGVVVYDGYIPKKALRRITIYDPVSNPVVTNAIVNARISLADYKRNYHRNLALTRWLMGESVSVEEWLGDAYSETPREERDQLTEQLQNKSGLDIFYYEPPPKGL
jgi:hypothetical protein